MASTRQQFESKQKQEDEKTDNTTTISIQNPHHRMVLHTRNFSKPAKKDSQLDLLPAVIVQKISSWLNTKNASKAMRTCQRSYLSLIHI